MEETVFYKLGMRLNEYPVKLPLVEPYLKVLREIYTEEEAQLGSEYPMGSYTLQEAVKLLKKDEKKLGVMLEKMANQGTMFTTKDKGVCRYSLTPFVPGVVEFQLMRHTDTPRDRRMAAAFEELMEGDMADLLRQLLAADKDALKNLIPVAPARTITIEKGLPSGSKIYPFEKASELISQETSFSATQCYCRHHAHLVDRDCKVKGIPEYSCLMFGKIADYVVDRGFGKRITKEESLAITKACAEAGLVHNVNNTSNGLVFMCNCCGCCCGFLRPLKKFKTGAMLASSNFLVKVDAKECTGCETCIDRCPVDALSMKDDVVAVDAAMCIGCGNCTSVCPTECLTMVRRAENKPPQVDNALKAMGI